ncbi:hypothetical protein [Phytoactinopolyspora halotolerans]|uniref:RNA polymerase sigma-70 region 4 domain-containing protein n=1 Tax=Phytoactinopolyspora halotolerans TaxID=1981512 RepID=A0A6L9S2K7_9ACTN|nr:hypothetical protein [Phytoactinopolyspora halotolerans]NED99286.1 hypothetical protein [Phytoactinopolyspora halotolerans]
MNAARYTCTAVKDDTGWLTHCDQHPGVCTHARTLSHTARLQRRALAAMLDVPEDDVTVDVQPVIPDAVHEHLDRARVLRETAAWARRSAHHETRSAVRLLNDLGLTCRDIGTILGVSYQRAHQLMNR